MSLGNKIYDAAVKAGKSRDAFELEVMKITGNRTDLLDLPDDLLFWRIAVAQEALNQLITAAEDRKLLTWENGKPIVPSAAPDDLDLTEIFPHHVSGPAKPTE